MISKLKYFYIFLFLILVSILVFIVQGLYREEATSINPVEFSRVDGYSAQLGKISEISVRIHNDDTVRHNYTVEVWMNSEFFTNETVEVVPGSPFSLSMVLPLEQGFENDTGLIEDATHNASFTVYRDGDPGPVDHIEFAFD